MHESAVFVMEILEVALVTEIYRSTDRTCSNDLAGLADMLLGFAPRGLAVSLLASVCLAGAIPSPSSLNSDITLLFNNDLQGEFWFVRPGLFRLTQ